MRQGRIEANLYWKQWKFRACTLLHVIILPGHFAIRWSCLRKADKTNLLLILGYFQIFQLLETQWFI